MIFQVANHTARVHRGETFHLKRAQTTFQPEELSQGDVRVVLLAVAPQLLLNLGLLLTREQDGERTVVAPAHQKALGQQEIAVGPGTPHLVVVLHVIAGAVVFLKGLAAEGAAKPTGSGLRLRVGLARRPSVSLLLPGIGLGIPPVVISRSAR